MRPSEPPRLLTLDQQASLAGIRTPRLDLWSFQVSAYAPVRPPEVSWLDHGSSHDVSTPGTMDWQSG